MAKDLQALFKYVGRAWSGDFFRTMAELELGITQLKTLLVLADAEELSVKGIAEALGLSLAAASRTVDSLVQRGLIERRECAADRRSRLVTLAPAGADAVRRVNEARLAGLLEFAKTLEDSEREALDAALRPIVRRLDK